MRNYDVIDLNNKELDRNFAGFCNIPALEISLLNSQTICHNRRQSNSCASNILEGVLMICDWCGEKYPISYSDYKNVHQLKNYANKPIVCNACYKKIQQTDALKIFTHNQIYQKPIEIKMNTKT